MNKILVPDICRIWAKQEPKKYIFLTDLTYFPHTFSAKKNMPEISNNEERLPYKVKG
jgi:hypothetical protein